MEKERLPGLGPLPAPVQNPLSKLLSARPHRGWCRYLQLMLVRLPCASTALCPPQGCTTWPCPPPQTRGQDPSGLNVVSKAILPQPPFLQDWGWCGIVTTKCSSWAQSLRRATSKIRISHLRADSAVPICKGATPERLVLHLRPRRCCGPVECSRTGPAWCGDGLKGLVLPATPHLHPRHAGQWAAGESPILQPSRRRPREIVSVK